MPARDADRFLLVLRLRSILLSWMRCDNDPTEHGLAFRTQLDLIGRQMQTCLNQRVIQHAVFFASGDKGEASQVYKHGSQAIVAVEAEQGTGRVELVRSEVARDGREALAQFHAILPIPAVANTAEPVITVGLAHCGASMHRLPAFATSVARSTDVIESTKGWRQIVAFQ